MILSETLTQRLMQVSAAYVVIIYFLCLGLPFGQTYSTPLLALAAVVLMLASRDKSTLAKGKSIINILLIFLVSSLFSTVFSIDTQRSLTIGLSVFPAVLIFMLIISHCNFQSLRQLLIGFSIVAACISLILIMIAWQSVDDDPVRWMFTASLNFLAVPNDLLFIALLTPFNLVLVMTDKVIMVKIISLISLLLTLLVIMIFRSNIALLIMITGMLMCVLLQQPRHALYLLIGSALLMFAIDWIQGFLLLSKFFHLQAWGNRIPLWLSAVHMFLDAPVLGHGPGAFSLLSDGYIEKMELPSWMLQDPRHAPWAHNLYLELLAERGLLGFCTALAAFGVIIHHLITICCRNTASRPMAIALLASLSGILLAGLFELSLIRHWLLILLTTLSAMTVVLIGQCPHVESR